MRVFETELELWYLLHVLASSYSLAHLNFVDLIFVVRVPLADTIDMNSCLCITKDMYDLSFICLDDTLSYVLENLVRLLP